MRRDARAALGVSRGNRRSIRLLVPLDRLVHVPDTIGGVSPNLVWAALKR